MPSAQEYRDRAVECDRLSQLESDADRRRKLEIKAKGLRTLASAEDWLRGVMPPDRDASVRSHSKK